MGVMGLEKAVGVTGPYELTVRSLRADCGRGTSDGDVSGSGICNRSLVGGSVLVPPSSGVWGLFDDPQKLGKLGLGVTRGDNASVLGLFVKVGRNGCVSRGSFPDEELGLDVAVEIGVEISVETGIGGSFELISRLPVNVGFTISEEMSLNVSVEMGRSVSVEMGLRVSLETC